MIRESIRLSFKSVGVRSVSILMNVHRRIHNVICVLCFYIYIYIYIYVENIVGTLKKENPTMVTEITRN